MVPAIYQQVVSDEVASTLKKSAISVEFYGERVKEIIEEALLSEKEVVIEKYMQEIAELKANLSEMHAEHTKHK